MKAVLNRLIEIDAITGAPLLRFRIDCYLEPGDPEYATQVVQVPNRPLTPEEANNPTLAALVSTVEQINPVNCHFVRVPADVTESQLRAVMRARLQALRKSMKELPRVRRFVGMVEREHGRD